MSNEKKTTLEAMLAQYESSTTSQGSQKTNFDLKNYFTTFLPDGIDSAVKRVRLLPVEQGSSPFVPVYVHSYEVDGKNRKFTCLAHEKDEPCPFCEAREELLATGEESDKELAKKYRPRLMYIAKVIDRENESEGPKFWRFPSNFKKEGILDKIMGQVRILQEDITDPETGYDIALNVERVKNPRGGSYPSVTTVMLPKSGPLSQDKAQAEAWISDEKTWTDVYSVKTYEYLAIVVKGGIPVWSKVKEKYVDKNDLDANDSGNISDELEAELKIGGTNKPETINEADLQPTYTADVDMEDASSDDLPF